MKNNYFKKMSLCVGLVALTLFGYSQNLQTMGAIYSTGGQYLAPNNLVKLGFYDTQLNELESIDSIPGDFSNFAHYYDGKAYFHVGRSTGHADGADVIKVYSTFDTIIDVATDMNGAKSIAVSDNHVSVLKGYGTDNGQYLEILDINSVNTRLFQDTLTMNTGGLALDRKNNKLFASFSTDSAGVIVSYNLDGVISKNGVVLSDTALYGIQQIFMLEDENMLVGVAKDAYYDLGGSEVIERALIFKYDIGIDSLSVYDVANVDGTVKYETGMLIGDFGAGVSLFEVAAGIMIVEPLSDLAYTDFEIDLDKQLVYSINTDFFSTGQVTVSGLFDGITVDSALVDISGASISLMQGYAPIAVKDTFEVAKNTTFEFDPTLNDTDIDLPQGASLFASCENTTTNGQVFYGTNGWEYQPNLDFIGLDTAYYEVNDNLGLTDQDMVVFHVTLEAGVEELRENTMSLYPNPTSSQLHVTLKESVKGLVSVKTIQGQEVIQQTINGDNLSLDVSHLSQGMYFMEIVGDDQVITETFEKQ